MIKTTLFTLLFVCFTLVASISVKPVILLLGSEATNEHKLTIAQHFISDVRLDEYLRNDSSSSNIVVLGRREHVEIFHSVAHNPHFSPVRIVQLDSISSTVVIVCLKGTNEMSLDELRTLHALIYEINSGVAAIEIGSNAIQTSSLLEYSTFCWASAKLKPEMIDVPAHAILCNGVKPSAVEIVIDVRPFVRDQPLDLPILPQHRFWPSMVVSASAEGEKKQRASKHTTQPPNARHTRVYGKDKKKDEAEEPNSKKTEVNAGVNKIACKYRRSCYETGKLDLEAIQAAKYAQPVSAQQTAASAAPVDPKELDSDKLKLHCKYRKSCYESGELPPIEAQPIFQPPEPKASSHPKDDDDDYEDTFDEKKMKLKCKYRPACYAEVGVEAPERKQPAAVPHVDHAKSKEASKQPTIKLASKSGAKNDEDDGRVDRIACKYRKSCYATGELDLDAIQRAKYAAPVSAHKSPSNTPIDPKELDEKDLKLRCKYRQALQKKQCYETGELPPIETFASAVQQPMVRSAPKRDEPLDIDDLEEDEKKLKCKYRKSCYETGVLPPIVEHVPVQKAVEEKPAVTNVADKKLACKYRKKCIEALGDEVEEAPKSTPAHVEEPDDEDEEGESEVKVEDVREDEPEKKEEEVEEPEVIPVPVVIQKQQKRRRAKDDDEREAEKKPASKKKSRESKTPEPPAVSKKAKKPAESSAEAKKRDPRRYVNKFKTVGKYEKLPKMAEVDDDDEEDAERPDELPTETPDEETAEDQREEEADDADVEGQIPIETTGRESHESGEESAEVQQEEEDEPPHADLLPAIHVPDEDESTEQEEPQPVEEEDEEHEEEEKQTPAEAQPIPVAPIVPVVHRHLTDEDKLRCKYRKSCMQGVEPPPTPVRPPVPAKTPSAPARPVVVNVRDYDDDLKLKCKYRISCMQQVSGEEVRPPAEKKPKDDDEREEEVQHVVPPLVHVNVSDVSKEDRERCKYRKSCYAGVESPPTVARTSTQSRASITPSGSHKPVIIKQRPREECKAEAAKYWLSCREHLGFPPKERAPIGPSGRRLCRKKRPDGNVSS